MKFVNQFNETLIKGSNNKLSVFGPQVKYIADKKLPDNIFIHYDHYVFIKEFLTEPVFI